MRLLSKLRESKHIEEILGLSGILYLLILAVLSFFFFRFLVQNIDLATTRIAAPAKSLPATFDLPLAEEAMKKP